MWYFLNDWNKKLKGTNSIPLHASLNENDKRLSNQETV